MKGPRIYALGLSWVSVGLHWVVNNFFMMNWGCVGVNPKQVSAFRYKHVCQGNANLLRSVRETKSPRSHWSSLSLTWKLRWGCSRKHGDLSPYHLKAISHYALCFVLVTFVRKT